MWQIHLTVAGRDLIERITSIDEVLRTELRTGISREERHALAAVTQQLQANLRHAMQPDA